MNLVNDDIYVEGNILYRQDIKRGVYVPVPESKKNDVKGSIGRAVYKENASLICRCEVKGGFDLLGTGEIKCRSCGRILGLKVNV